MYMYCLKTLCKKILEASPAYKRSGILSGPPRARPKSAASQLELARVPRLTMPPSVLIDLATASLQDRRIYIAAITRPRPVLMVVTMTAWMESALPPV